MLAGLSAIVIAVGVLIRGPAIVRAWIDRQAAEADAARARADVDAAEAEQIALDRRRTLQGWSPGGVETYTVALVTDQTEMERATAELTGGGPTSYVVLRVDEGESGSENRALSLRTLIEGERYLCRPPTLAEREAMEKGFEALGVQIIHHWPRAGS